MFGLIADVKFVDGLGATLENLPYVEFAFEN